MTDPTNTATSEHGDTHADHSGAAREQRALRRLRWAAVLSLVALGLIVWSLFDPTPVPIILSMSLGQVIGTFAFLLYLLVVVPELWRSMLGRVAGGDMDAVVNADTEVDTDREREG